MMHIVQRYSTSMRELLPWREEWNSLAERQRLPLACFEWFQAAEANLAESGSVKIVYLVDADAHLVAAAALEAVHDAVHGMSYQLLGMRRLYEPSDLLYRDDKTRDKLLAALVMLKAPVIVGRSWPHGKSAQHPASTNLGRYALRINRPAAASQFLDLSGSYTEFLDSLSPQRRYDLRRAYRRAAEAGRLDSIFLLPKESEVAHHLETVFGIESRSWKRDTGSCVIANPDLQGFYTQISQEYAQHGSILVTFLRINKMPIAAQLCIVYGNRVWILKIAYDDTYRRYSPGMLLINELIKYSHENALDGIEFLGSAESWLEAWRPRLRHYELMALYPYSLEGMRGLCKSASIAISSRLRGNKSPVTCE